MENVLIWSGGVLLLVGTACRRRWALEMADAGGLHRQ